MVNSLLLRCFISCFQNNIADAELLDSALVRGTRAFIAGTPIIPASSPKKYFRAGQDRIISCSRSPMAGPVQCHQ